MLLSCTLILGIVLGPALVDTVSAADYYCVPIETAILANRAHVRCSEPVFLRNGYPRDPPGSSNRISYFAVPLTDEVWANRFLRTTDLAQVSGLTLYFSYTPGDFSGEAFGCDRQDCRTPWAVALVKVPPPWTSNVVFSSGFEAP